MNLGGNLMYNMPNTTMYNETSSTTLPTGAIIWILIALIVAIIGGICLYFTVFSDKNKGKYTGFMGWLYDFVKFKKYNYNSKSCLLNFCNIHHISIICMY